MLQSLKLLLPALVPSWRFFDEIAPSPRIEIALLKTPHDFATEWQEFRPRPKRLSFYTMLKSLLWNPVRNENLFLVSCAERLETEPTDHSLHEILKRIRADISDGNFSPLQAPYFQFRLLFLDRQGDDIQKQVTFVSAIYSSSEGGKP